MEREHEFLRQNLNYLFQLSIVFNKLKGEYVEYLEPPLDKIFISSIARTLIQGIASLFDPVEDKWGNKNLVVHLIKDADLGAYKDTLDKVSKIRNKVISHNDSESNIRANNFIDEVNLTPEEIEKLLIHVIDLLEKVIGQKTPIADLEKNCFSALEKLFQP
jgi:hypothetical protein